jgi:hypothetical protein
MNIDSVKDYRVTIKVRNARIINAFAEKDEVVGLFVASPSSPALVLCGLAQSLPSPALICG